MVDANVQLLQTWFNTSTQTIWDQGGAATDGQACMYRAPNGLRCAVGALIPDEQYALWMDGEGGVKEVLGNPLAEDLPFYSAFSHNLQFLFDLQDAHDSALSSAFADHADWEPWFAALRRIAHHYNLDASLVDTLQAKLQS